MNGRIILNIEGKDVTLWFNNYSKVEIGKKLLASLDGYDPRPEEELLIKAINELAKTNYLQLITILVNAGVIGYAFGTNQSPALTPTQISMFIAEADSKSIYGIWKSFLQAYGFDLLIEEDEDTVKGLSPEEKKKVI